MKKILLSLGVTVLIVAIVGLVVLALSLGGLVKTGVETFGPKLAGVEIKLDKVDLSLLSGAGQLSGLVVGNPAGFNTPHAIRVGGTTVAVQPGSILSSKIVISTIKVDAPEITLETGLNGTNLKKILDNLNAATGGNTNAAAPAKSGGSGKKFEVDDFLITGAKLNFSVTGLGGQTVTLPEIHLTNLGKGSDGLSSAELAKQVLGAIEQAAAKAASASAGDIAKGAANLVNGLSGKTNGGALQDLGNLFKRK